MSKHLYEITFVSNDDHGAVFEIEAEKCEVDGMSVIADGIRLHFWTDQIEVKSLSI